jgi:hypothetical protein
VRVVVAFHLARPLNAAYDRLVHVVSTAHTLLIVPLAWRCLGLSALENDRAFGWDWRVGQAEGVAIGFVVDPPAVAS